MIKRPTMTLLFVLHLILSSLTATVISSRQSSSSSLRFVREKVSRNRNVTRKEDANNIMGIRIRSAFIVQHANRAQAAQHPNPCYPTQPSNNNMHRNPNEMLRPCPPKSSNPILIQTYVDNVVLTNTSHRADIMII